MCHCDNNPEQRAIGAKQLLVKKLIKVHDLSPNPPDFASCDVWLFPRLKMIIKTTHFATAKETKASVRKNIKSLKRLGVCLMLFRGWQNQILKCIDSDR